jgi:hypothetical protein
MRHSENQKSEALGVQMNPYIQFRNIRFLVLMTLTFFVNFQIHAAYNFNLNLFEKEDGTLTTEDQSLPPWGGNAIDNIELKLLYQGVPIVELKGKYNKNNIEKQNIGLSHDTIKSKLPILEIKLCGYSEFENKGVEEEYFQTERLTLLRYYSYKGDNFRCKWFRPKNPSYNLKILSQDDGIPPYIGGFTFSSPSVNLEPQLKNTSLFLSLYYKKSLKNLSLFTKGLRKIDRPLVSGLYAALSDIIRLLESKNGEPLRAVTHEQIREQSRLIMLLATVFSETLENYSHLKELVPEMNYAIKQLENLANDLRMSLVGMKGLLDPVLNQLPLLLQWSKWNFLKFMIPLPLWDIAPTSVF